MTTDAPTSAAAAPPRGTDSPLPGPDFFCVGLQKGGTQWLYDQLQHHADFWMPPFKELHYFDRPFPYDKLAKAARNFLERPTRAARRRMKRGDVEVSPEGAAFYRHVAAFEAPPGDFDAYVRLFEPKGRLLSGDVTPGYSTLDEELIGRLAARFDRAKVILMLREPASRAWSHWRMANRDEPESVVLDVDGLRAFLDRPDVAARSYPSRIAARWSAAFGERFRFYFLDDVARRPAETRAGILSFLGADPERPMHVGADYNRKAKHPNLERTDAIRALLRKRFQDERIACAKYFGAAATAWPDAAY